MHISILGCGWLGLPLATSLIQKGYQVKGATTTPDKVSLLKEEGIDPYIISVAPDHIEGDIASFLDSDVLILNVPPRRKNEDVVHHYPACIAQLLTYIVPSRIRKVIFISTTSVYQNTNNTVTEDIEPTPTKASGKAVLAAEKHLQSCSHITTTVIRLAGLIGKDRHPGRFLSGKQHLPNGAAPVNLIHLDDCINLITGVLTKGIWGEVFNGCADQHPTRKAFYTKPPKS